MLFKIKELTHVKIEKKAELFWDML